MWQNFEDAVAKVFEAYNFFVRRQNVLFLHSYSLSGHLISRTWLDVCGLLVRTRLQKRKIGNYKKIYAIFLQITNSIFCCGAGSKENRCYSLKMASLGSTY